MINPELIRMFLLRQWRLVLVVASGAGALACFLTGLFPGMDPETTASIASAWPPLIRKVFGDPLEGFTSVYGWLDMQFFHITYWVIFAGLFSVVTARIVAREIEGKTLDILLSYPVSRRTLLYSRVAALTALAAFSAVPAGCGCAVGILIAGKPLVLGPLLAVSVNGMMLVLVCAHLTLVISTLWPNQILAITAALSVFGMFFACEYMVVPLHPWLAWTSSINPFHYYASAAILTREHSCIGDCLVLSGMCLGFPLQRHNGGHEDHTTSMEGCLLIAPSPGEAQTHTVIGFTVVPNTSGERLHEAIR